MASPSSAASGRFEGSEKGNSSFVPFVSLTSRAQQGYIFRARGNMESGSERDIPGDEG